MIHFLFTNTLATHAEVGIACIIATTLILHNNRKFLNWSLASLAAKAAASLANKAK